MKTSSRIKALSSTIALITGATILTPVAAAEDKEEFTWGAYLETGAQYNTNISVNEIESAAGISDTALLLDTGFDLSWTPAEKLNIDSGYSFSTSKYREASDYDLDLHLLYGDISYDFSALNSVITIGSNVYHADASLGGEGFLTLDQYSVYAGKLLGENWYLRGALNSTDKHFDQLASRDADNNGFSTDAYWFLNDGRTSVVFGYAFEDETTSSDEYNYTANTFRLRLTQQMNLLSKDSKLSVGLRSQNRGYAYITPVISEKRDDRQQVIDAALEVSLNSWLDVIAGVKLSDFSSNLESADYSDNQASVSVRASF